MYQFILNMWVMRRVTSTEVQNFVTKGHITQEEADKILINPQV